MTVLLESELDDLQDAPEPASEEDEVPPTGEHWREKQFKRKAGRPSYQVQKDREKSLAALTRHQCTVRCARCGWSHTDRADRALEAARLHRPCRTTA